MGKSLAEIRSLPAAELAEWQAYSLVEGLPDWNRAQAHVCSATTNAMCGAESTVDDFLLLPRAEIELRKAEAKSTRKPLTPEQTAEQVGRILRGQPPCDSSPASKAAGRSSATPRRGGLSRRSLGS